MAGNRGEGHGWIASGLASATREGVVRFVPTSLFPRAARLLTVIDRDGTAMAWGDLAERNGWRLSPESRLREISQDAAGRSIWDEPGISEPLVGPDGLGQLAQDRLATLLVESTSTPSEVLGVVDSRDWSCVEPTTPGKAGGRGYARRAPALGPRRTPDVTRIAGEFVAHGRTFRHLPSPIDLKTSPERLGDCPGYYWPKGREWMLVWSIDRASMFVLCHPQLHHQLLNEPSIEALDVTEDQT